MQTHVFELINVNLAGGVDPSHRFAELLLDFLDVSP